MAATNDEQAARWKSDFGKRVRELRNERGLSQMQLAHASELDPTYISSIERGRRNISLVNMHALARSLAVTPHAFFGPEEAPPAS